MNRAPMHESWDDVCLSLLAVAMVLDAVLVLAAALIANWHEFTADLASQPTEAQAAADTAADLQDAIAAARLAALNTPGE